ncbi:Ig-like domain repeat protein [Microbaculum sp. FT89]|uniref:RCC1 domain-containing protein n=1 Tax=Microbaculum sp. FT89 TaxID=3447298 RepID=UPI003F52D4C0
MHLDIACTIIRKPFLAGLMLAAGALPFGTAFAGPTSTNLSASSARSAFGQAVTYSAVVKGGGPTGTVTFRAGSATLGSGILEILSTASSLSTGATHTCAVTASGGARCWGSNSFGKLGVGPAGDQTTPVPVSGLSSGVAAIVAGTNHTCALTEGGAVLCWGANGFGELGDGTTIDRNVPVAVSGLSGGVKAIAAGGYHSCAVLTTGAVRCWGRNVNGAIGDGTTTDRHVPAAVAGLADVQAVTTGLFHSCAMTDTGAASCWGSNSRGQIGDGTTTDRYRPVPVSGLSSGVADIVAGRGHTCAVTGTGAARCWGYNNMGQIGDGTTTERHTPVLVSGLTSGATTVTGGDYHSCALIGNGAARCWGFNGVGNLGDGTIVNRETPVAVSAGASGAVNIVAGSNHTCALTKTGGARCWGYNNSGQIGDGTITDRETPVAVDGYDANGLLVSAGALFSTSALAAGNHAITAHYAGDAGNDASASPALTQVVVKGRTRTKFRIKPRKPKAGAAARMTVRVKARAPAAGKPVGKVVVKDGRRKLGTFKVRKGKASVRLRGLSAGTHKIKAVYRGNKNWKKSAARKGLTVRTRQTTIRLSP